MERYSGHVGSWSARNDNMHRLQVFEKMNASSFEEVRLCLLGDSGVGKSSIVHRFVYDAFKPTMEATIGAAFFTKSIVFESTTFKYQIWDTAGPEKYWALAPIYYRGAAAAIIVYDMTVEQGFATVKMWVRELKQNAELDVVMAIAGNKPVTSKNLEKSNTKMQWSTQKCRMHIHRDKCKNFCQRKQFAARLKAKGGTYTSEDSSASVILQRRNASEDGRTNNCC